ncbi:MAG: outer membrane protein assembly factor BamA [Alphaproteobacteria bacterium]|jgi:outer membrane protein insertion porin family|nr:outer membrane protein assembly factor BamA [Alphaproteobacteria bacterium]
MKRFKLIIIILLINCGLANAKTIDNINVSGNKRIETETVISYLALNIGDEISNKELSKSLKNLYATNLFADISISEDKGTIYVRVLENPIVNEIAFEGNVRIKNDFLQRELSLYTRSVYTKSKVQNNLERLKQIYEKSGYFGATINPKIIVLDDNRVNVVFEINEGTRAKIRKINIIGNENYSDDLLKDKISTKESRWYKFLSGNTSYDADRIDYDKELLRRFYLSRGYADFQVQSITSKLTKDKKSFYITVKVEEGERYRFSKVETKALLKDVNQEEINSIVNELTKTGDWYSSNKIEKAVLALTKSLENQQYAFVKVSPDVSKNDDNKEISIVYNIGEGQKVFVNNINVSGNERTRDEVIRREFKLIEGDAFNRDKLIKTERDLRNLDFFDKVNVKVKEVDKGLTDINVNVSEKSTGEFSMGAGFSTEDGALADFSISEDNFLGKGQKVKLGTVLSGKSQQIDFGFTEPYFLNRDLSAGFDIFNVEKDYQDESSYDKKLTGFALRLGYPLKEDLRQNIAYNFEKSNIYNVGEDASTYIKEQAGNSTKSSISSVLTYDTRDSAFDPTEGTLLKMSNELAGLGGLKFIKNTVGGGFYYPLSDQWIFSNYTEAGNVFAYGGDDINISDRFFIGGKTLRGFERSGIGPRDKKTDDALGGENYIKNSMELSFPLGVSQDLGLKGYSFLDAGTLWGATSSSSNIHDDSSVRASFGVGLAWKSPMGPLRINLAFPFLKEDYDKDEVFSFTFGTRF